MFYIFTKVCEKHGFTFSLSTYNGYTLILRPHGSFCNFDNIEIKQNCFECSYFKLFMKAIKEMKAYRKGSERP